MRALRFATAECADESIARARATVQDYGGHAGAVEKGGSPA